MDGDLIDVGCGSGWVLAELESAGVAPSRLHGVDLIEARVSAATERLPAADIRQCDARNLPFADGRFAIALMLTVLSSIGDADGARKVLAEARRVLRPDGLVIVYEPWVPNPLNRATIRVPGRLPRGILGPCLNSLAITGFPPLARRLGPRTESYYGTLTRLAPTHRIAAYRRST